MSTFRDQVVLITGAGSGIGRGLALGMAREGARVAALDLRAEGLASLEKEVAAGQLAWREADVTDRPGLSQAVADLQERLGPIQVAVASAGVGRETSAASFDPADLELLVRVNLVGVANTFAAVLPGMRARRAGHLVALSSLASYRGLPRMAGYCASKAGVNALCDSFRVELQDEGIAVSTICPGFIRTPMTAHLMGLRKPPGMLELDDAVARILAGIRRRQPFLAFPSSSLWQVRLMRYLPRWLADRIARGYYVRSLPPEGPGPSRPRA